MARGVESYERRKLDKIGEDVAVIRSKLEAQEREQRANEARFLTLEKRIGGLERWRSWFAGGLALLGVALMAAAAWFKKGG